MGNKELKDTEQLLQGINEIARTISNEVVKLDIFTNKIYDTAGNVLKSLAEAENSFHRMAINAGKSGNAYKELNNTAIELQKNLGASRKESLEIVSAFTERQFSGNLKEMATATQHFAKATGMSRKDVADTITEISKSTGMSDKAIQSSMASILKIQQSNGITKKGIEAINESIKTTTFNMKAFGKSDEAIKAMVGNTAKLVSAIEKVGLSAEFATGMIDKLTDPERINENIKLYSALGISMTDALNGEDITGQLQVGLKDFGARVKEMGPIAGAAYAKAFGMSYKEAVKASNMEEVTEDATTPEDKALVAMQELANNTKTTMETFQESIEKFTAGIYKVPKEILVVMFAVGKLMSITTKSSITEAAKSGKAIANKNVIDIGNRVKEIRKQINNAASQEKAFEEQITQCLKNEFSITKEIDKVNGQLKNTKDALSKNQLKSLKEELKLQKQLNEEQYRQTRKLDPNKADTTLAKVVKGYGEKDSGTAKKAQRMLMPKGMSKMFSSLGSKIGKLGSTITKGPLSIISKLFPALTPAVAGIGAALGPLLGILLPILAIFLVLKLALSKLQPQLERLGKIIAIMKEKVLDKILEFLKPIIDFLKKIIDGISNFLMKIFHISEEDLNKNTKAIEENTESEQKSQLSVSNNGSVQASKATYSTTESQSTASPSSNNTSVAISSEDRKEQKEYRASTTSLLTKIASEEFMKDFAKYIALEMSKTSYSENNASKFIKPNSTGMMSASAAEGEGER